MASASGYTEPRDTKPVRLDGHTFALDFQGGTNVVYAGTAVAGSSKADPVWKIRRLTYDGDNVTDVQLADGAPTFHAIWDNRTGYSYS